MVDTAQLSTAVAAARQEYEELKTRGLKLDITRGKPCPDQLDLANGMLDLPGAGDYTTPDVGDLRNYGGAPKGLQQLREIFAPLLDVPVDHLVARDNSSLALMHQCVATSFFHAPGGAASWQGQGVKFLAPSPGYDRHFGVCVDLGVDLVVVPMTPEGPDMDVVERLVADDPTIKGIWCVPKYSNPTGITFSSEVVHRLARMATAAPDFRIYWDNAYALHHLRDTPDHLDDLLAACAEAGNPDRAFLFASTSKISFAGSGVAFFASSPANVEWFLKHDALRSIGPDKLNQLRHERFFLDRHGVVAHMQKHRAILEPKFDAVLRQLSERLGDLGIATWTDPRGGYFVSVDVVPGTAKRVVELAKAVGVALTPAGATFPYGNDPDDRNIRIAPSYPSAADVDAAMRVFTTCVILAAGETLL